MTDISRRNEFLMEDNLRMAAKIEELEREIDQKAACNMRQFEEIKELQAKVDRLSARGIQDMQHSIKIYKTALRRIVALNDHTFQLQDAMEIARVGLLEGEA